MPAVIGSSPKLLDDLLGLMDAKVAAAVGKAPEQATHRYGTITGIGPVRVRLDGDAAEIGFSPVCLYQAKTGDRVLCVIFGRQVAILGQVSAGSDSGWQTLTGFGDGWGSGQYTEAEDAVWRRRGGEVVLEGLVYRWGSGAGFGQLASGMPTPRSGSSTLIGMAQYASGGTAPLTVAWNGQLNAESTGATGTCNTSDWVRLTGRYDIA